MTGRVATMATERRLDGGSAVRLLCLGLVAGLSLGLTAGAGNSATLEFDDLYEGVADDGAVPWDYGGIPWWDTGWWATSASLDDEYGPNGYSNTWAGGVGIFTLGETDVWIGGTVFDFTGARVGAAWNLGQEVTFQGWRDGGLVYSSTLVVDTDGADFDFTFNGIDELGILPDLDSGTQDPEMAGWGHHIALDNLEITVASTPEPGTFAMLALAGVPMIGGALRRRFRSN